MWPPVLSERVQNHANASSRLVDTTPLDRCSKTLHPSGHKDNYWKATWRPCSSLAVCRASPEGLTLERPQELSSSAASSRGQRRTRLPEWETDREEDISRHNQVRALKLFPPDSRCLYGSTSYLHCASPSIFILCLLLIRIC